MKNLIFCLISVVMFGSCEPAFINELPRKYPFENQRIVNIETIAHNKNIVVYHMNQKVNRPHIKVSILEMVGDLDNSYANLILGLKEQAQEEGLDAVVIYYQGINQRSEWNVDGYGGALSFKEISAYGIVYKENLDLSKHFPKTEIVYGYNSFDEKFEKIATKTININQRLIAVEGEDNLSKILQPYSQQHLLRDVQNWSVQKVNNQVKERTYRNSLGLTKECQFIYDSLNRVSEVNIEVIQDKIEYKQFIFQLVKFYYNEDGQLHRKLIYPNIKKEKVIYYEEVFKYEAGVLTEKLLYNINGSTKSPIAKFQYIEYYTMSDLEKIFPELN